MTVLPRGAAETDPTINRAESVRRRRHGRPSLHARHMTFRCPSMPPALQIGPRARAQMSFAVCHLLGTLAVGGAEGSSHHRLTIARLHSGAIWTMDRVYPRVRKAPALRRCLGFALQPLPRATAAATQGRRAKGLWREGWVSAHGRSRILWSKRTSSTW
jgi:hypothetical protein